MIHDYFKLKPIKAAKVSEISEATSAAPVKADERVNFHIGHPIQDEQLTALFRQLVFQTDQPTFVQSEADFRQYLQTLNLDSDLIEKMCFVYRAIPICNPYMARGGYSWRHPTPLIRQIIDWFEKNQLETIQYDSGEKSGHKELMLGSGGLVENLRVLFFTLNRFLEKRPANILFFEFSAPPFVHDFQELNFYSLPRDEDQALTLIEQLLQANPQLPHFLLLGAIPREPFRRRLRHLALESALFIVELNNAPNHLSLAREALLEQRVLRFLTPAVFNPHFAQLSTTLIAGRADYIQHLETVHFQLKGTPSAPEAELFYFLLNNPPTATVVPELQQDLIPTTEQTPFLPTSNILNRTENILQTRKPNFTLVNRLSQNVEKWSNQLISDLFRSFPVSTLPDDPWMSHSPWQIVDQFFTHLNNPDWGQQLEDRFLDAFVSVHPEYQRQACFAVSGSARTALSLLGFHGPIKKVVTFDLGWTYEHCFPQVFVLPINPLTDFSAKQVIEQIEQIIEKDNDFLKSGALIFNNPHNATGALIPENVLKEIYRWALQKGLYLIDDLSYQNVGPWKEPKQIPTLRQTINQLISQGYLTPKHLNKIITCHSLSKTDSFAGARLTVVEILNPQLRQQFEQYLHLIKKHRLPLLIAYLFYRNGSEKLEAYWHFRNRRFAERMAILQKAMDELPLERNPYQIELLAPRGSMYPLLFIQKLPAGISLDALSTTLANQGIGLVPLTTFACTAAGFQMARKAFRLTLGGHISGEKLYYQMRRVLIDLNRIIAQQATLFQKQTLVPSITISSQPWQSLLERIRLQSLETFDDLCPKDPLLKQGQKDFRNHFLPQRLQTIEEQFKARYYLLELWRQKETKEKKALLKQLMEKEFYKDDLKQRQQRFLHRLFDRTVHPTQMFSIQVDRLTRQMVDRFLLNEAISDQQMQALVKALIEEFKGQNVPINSIQESEELLLDLDSFIDAEHLTLLEGKTDLTTFLSYWGDWDGSSRPSGQGHRLVAAVLIKNVARLARLLNLLLMAEPDLKMDNQLREELKQFPQRRKKFWQLLNKITFLTNQLEKRYQTLLPFSVNPSPLRKIGMKLHLLRDPLTVLWQHNDRLERKMRSLRLQRRQHLEYYFHLNKKLRKTLFQHIETLTNHLNVPALFYHALFYRDLLRRFVLTPRIHQNLITSHDPFAIDTTVFNIMEINELGAQVGNSGLILGLQISMCNQAEALIKLEQKLTARREAILRQHPDLPMPNIWLVPLFEERGVVQNIEQQLNALWQYARNRRSTKQTVEERFRELLCEIFVAGSDLSQQVSQTVAEHLYRELRFKVVRWLARKGLAGKIRIKLGSGEPMQRQGGFYDDLGSLPAFDFKAQKPTPISKELTPSAAKACEFAVTPLRGVLSSGDLRTLQSTISEKLRLIPVTARTNFLYHLRTLQQYFEHEIIRASEPLVQTRLRFGERGEKELKRLTMNWSDPLYEKFLEVRELNFRQIVYGREEDIVGIHLASYFISRMVPAFRDRPTVRPGKVQSTELGPRVIERLSRVLPQARYGTMLRAIGHNRAQTMILGIAQLTTGLFRALEQFCNEQVGVLSQQLLLQERILPHLPVYEILRDLRLYQDMELKHWSRLEPYFPPGNSALSALREDITLIRKYIPFLQRELIRRHGLNVSDFFENNHFKINLLPAMRPDLVVLLQPNLFNTRLENLLQQITVPSSLAWQKEVQNLLNIPNLINQWRDKIWRLIEQKIINQVESFVQLAQAIMQLLQQQQMVNGTLSSKLSLFQRNVEQLTSGLQSIADENFKQFLLAAVEYLTQSQQQGLQIPVNVIRALHDVERIVQIESQPLSLPEQNELRFYILQIARLTGENG